MFSTPEHHSGVQYFETKCPDGRFAVTENRDVGNGNTCVLYSLHSSLHRCNFGLKGTVVVWYSYMHTYIIALTILRLSLTIHVVCCIHEWWNLLGNKSNETPRKVVSWYYIIDTLNKPKIFFDRSQTYASNQACTVARPLQQRSSDERCKIIWKYDMNTPI